MSLLDCLCCSRDRSPTQMTFQAANPTYDSRLGTMNASARTQSHYPAMLHITSDPRAASNLLAHQGNVHQIKPPINNSSRHQHAPQPVSPSNSRAPRESGLVATAAESTGLDQPRAMTAIQNPAHRLSAPSTTTTDTSHGFDGKTGNGPSENQHHVGDPLRRQSAQPAAASIGRTGSIGLAEGIRQTPLQSDVPQNNTLHVNIPPHGLQGSRHTRLDTAKIASIKPPTAQRPESHLSSSGLQADRTKPLARMPESVASRPEPENPSYGLKSRHPIVSRPEQVHNQPGSQNHHLADVQHRGQHGIDPKYTAQVAHVGHRADTNTVASLAGAALPISRDPQPGAQVRSHQLPLHAQSKT